MEHIQGKITPVRQLWHRWKALRNVPFRRKWFVGYDLEANTFWEFQAERGGRYRRLVEYFDKKHTLAEYSQKKVHPRWSSWLTFTRPTPPSLQELVADEQRQQVMKILAQRADERWKNESVLADDKRVLHEKILIARSAIGDGPNPVKTQTQEQEHKPTLSPPKRTVSPQTDDSPIETAHIQPRR